MPRAQVGSKRGLRRVSVVAVLALFALATLAAPAAASSTFSWSLSCKGNASAVISWTWTQGETTLGAGGTSCHGDEVAEDSGAARPDGADGIRVTVVAAGVCSSLHFKTVSKSFSVDGSFKVSVHASVSENANGPSCSGHYSEHAAFSMSG